MSRGNATDRGAVFELVELKGKKKDVMATADEESHYQSLTLNREAAKKAESVYMVPMPRNKELVEAKITCEPKEELNLQNSKNAGLQHQVKSPDKKFLAKLCLFFVILGIGIIFVAFITLVSFAVYNYKEVQIKEDMLEKLRQQVENLEEQNEAQARAMNTTREKLNSIDMMLRSTIESTSTSLFSINASLHTTQDQLEEHFTEAQRSISSIAMDVANLNDSRVNFSQNCHRESRSCTSDTADYYDDYSLDCRTGQLSINRTDYYTMDMRCEHNSNSGYLDSDTVLSQVLEVNGSQVGCHCIAEHITQRSYGNYPLYPGTQIHCELVVIRCLSIGRN